MFPQTPGLQPLLPPPFSLDPPANSPFTTPASTSTTTLSICGTSMAQLKNFGERELKRTKLEPATDSDFRTYLAVSRYTTSPTRCCLKCLETSNKDERDALQALWTLQVRDQLSKLTQTTAESWTASSALEVRDHLSSFSDCLDFFWGYYRRLLVTISTRSSCFPTCTFIQGRWWTCFL